MCSAEIPACIDPPLVSASMVLFVVVISTGIYFSIPPRQGRPPNHLKIHNENSRRSVGRQGTPMGNQTVGRGMGLWIPVMEPFPRTVWRDHDFSGICSAPTKLRNGGGPSCHLQEVKNGSMRKAVAGFGQVLNAHGVADTSAAPPLLDSHLTPVVSGELLSRLTHGATSSNSTACSAHWPATYPSRADNQRGGIPSTP